jgi:hypothetical protein
MGPYKLWLLVGGKQSNGWQVSMYRVNRRTGPTLEWEPNMHTYSGVINSTAYSKVHMIPKSYVP